MITSLVISICVGVLSGAIVGLFFIDIEKSVQLEFVEGISLSIITEKVNFVLGETVMIKIINSGTTQLIFDNTSYGLQITSLNGKLLYSPDYMKKKQVLEPRDEKMFVWNQIKNDGELILPGRYKIRSTAFDSTEHKITKYIVIDINK